MEFIFEDGRFRNTLKTYHLVFICDFNTGFEVNYALKSEYFEKYEAVKKFWPIRKAELHGESA